MLNKIITLLRTLTPSQLELAYVAIRAIAKQ